MKRYRQLEWGERIPEDALVVDWERPWLVFPAPDYTHGVNCGAVHRPVLVEDEDGDWGSDGVVCRRMRLLEDAARWNGGAACVR